jgi:hypothetical protein
MIRASMHYPNIPGARFDFPCHAEKHVPVSIRFLSPYPGFKDESIDR